MKLAIALLIALTTPSFCQWRSLKISSGTDVNAIQENFRRASLWSNRKLDRFSNDTLYGQPIFKNGVKFGDGTIQNTAIPSTSSFLVAPATFTILTPAQVIPSSATGYYGIRVATATYLATAPGACSAGDFISALAADGTKTCGTPSGSGDVVKAATQTFTGANTFTGSVTVSSFTATSTATFNQGFGIICPSGFTNITKFGRQMGCLQTTANSAAAFVTAILACNTSYGAGLPSAAQWVASHSNGGLTYTNSTYEWIDGFWEDGSTTWGNIVQYNGSTYLLARSASSGTRAYRCWISR